ncbi:structural maintenance of chromosomes protein 2-like [Stegodyphus dumicola]|uniref:structural maintenance of chromosomes protein 2-like n=1 Tax=Stegodyphus dumicola TaxID=202533 RepID=UPI0015A9003C|nr:structural maintenance of chromosomes protein 2-like [Stegodyphus dumicola]
MIEEACGTRMYEDKKENALKNLEKKDSRLREINTMLNEHICPQLEKLKAERKEYNEYTKAVREYEHLSKIYIAWDYLKTEELVNKSGDEKKELQNKFEQHKQSITEIKKKLEEADKKISEIEMKMDEDGGKKLHALDEELKQMQVAETKADTQHRNLKDALKEEVKKKAELTKNFKDEKYALAQKEKELEKLKKKLEELKLIYDQDNEAITAAENHFHAVNAGLSDANGEEASLAAQLIAAGKDKKDAETEEKSLEMSIKHMKADLEKRKGENKKVDKSYTQDQNLYQNLDTQVKKLKADIAKLGYQEGKYENLIAQEKKLLMEVDKLKDELDMIFANFPQLTFEYMDPVKNFDRRKVRGPACLQLELKDRKDAVALEVTAGGKV